MPRKLPILSGKEVIKALSKVGFAFDHQRGSHIVLRRADPPHRRLAVPNYDELSSPARGDWRPYWMQLAELFRASPPVHN